MPTYEYRCPKGHQFELFQRMSDEPKAKCPTCGADAERILSGGAGFLFKGEGFYITDYRSESYQKAAKEERGQTKGAQGSTDSGGAGDESTGTGGSTSSGSTDKGSGSSTGKGDKSASPPSSASAD